MKKAYLKEEEAYWRRGIQGLRQETEEWKQRAADRQAGRPQ
jgi:hypothetical protein